MVTINAKSKGGGGGALVKRNSAGDTLDVILLDLFEAEDVNGFEVDKNNDKSTNDQVEDALSRLKSVDFDLWYESKRMWKIVKNNQVALKPNIRIEPPSDANSRFIKDGYKLEGMMYFDDFSNNLFLKQELFDFQKTNTEKAASLVHETIFKVWRNHNRYSDGTNIRNNDSTLVRKITGCLFTNKISECLNLESDYVVMPKSKDPYHEKMAPFVCKSAPGPTQTIMHVLFKPTEESGSPYIDRTKNYGAIEQLVDIATRQSFTHYVAEYYIVDQIDGAPLMDKPSDIGSPYHSPYSIDLTGVPLQNPYFDKNDLKPYTGNRGKIWSYIDTLEKSGHWYFDTTTKGPAILFEIGDARNSGKKVKLNCSRIR